MPEPPAAAAEVESLRCLRAALVGEPVPVIAGDTQAVIARMPERAAAALAGRLGDEAAPGLALTYIETRLAEALLADVVTTPEDPPR